MKKKILLFTMLACVCFAQGDMSQYRSAALEKSAAVKTSPGRLYFITGYNSGPEQFVQIHDAAALPSDSAVPLRSYKIFSGRNFAIGLGEPGVECFLGIQICNSTTAATKTIGADDCLFYVTYR